LPGSGKPPSFRGAVGNYRISATVDKDSVGVDEPITMKVILAGSGNIKSLPAITFPEMQDFRVYESGKTESIDNSGGVVSGSKTFEQAVIPVTSGDFRIPSIEFSFFNPDERKYRTIRTSPIDITASGEALVDIAGTPKNVIGAGQKSFAYIITEFPDKHSQLDIYKSPLFWLIQVGPLAAVIAAVFMRIRSRKMMGDRAYARRMTAGKNSRARFKSALLKKNRGDIEGFYAELYASLVGYIADRLDLDTSALTVEDIKMLEALDPDFRNELVNFLDKSQIARFAPGSNSTRSAEETANQASGLLSRLEKKL
jgi:hypothetical protein